MPSASDRAVSSFGSTLRVCSASAMAPSRRERRAAQAERLFVERHLVAVLDAIGEARFDFFQRDRRGQHDARIRGAAGQFGDRDERLARQRRGLIDIAAAAVRQRERAVAAVLRDAVRIGEREDRARRSVSSPLPLAGRGRSAPSSLHRFAIARASRARGERSRRKFSTRCVRSTSSPPSPRSVSTAAMSAASAPAPSRAASTTMRASRGGSGRRRNAWPSSVMRPSSSAPSSVSNARASASAPFGGGSRKASVSGAAPQAARSSTKPERSAERISGRA